MSGEYRVSVSFLDDGLVFVQVEGVPYPLGMFKESGYDLSRLLADARNTIVAHHNSVVAD